MASPEELTLSLPETLPEDFNEWDSEGSPTAEPENLRELWQTWEVTHPFSENPKPLEESVDRSATQAISADEPRVSGSASFTQVFVKHERDFSDGDSEASPKVEPENLRELWDAWEVTQPFSEGPKPLEESVDRSATQASSVETPRDPGSASSASVFVKQQEEFSDGDSEGSPTPKTDNLREREAWEATHPFSERLKPLEPSVDRAVTSASSVDTPRVSGSVSSSSMFVKQQEEFSDGKSEGPPKPKTDNLRELWKSSEWWESWKVAHHSSETAKPAELSDAPKVSDEYETWEDLELDEEQRRAKRKFVTVAAVSVCLTLLALILMLPQLHNGLRFVAEQLAQQPPEASSAQPEPYTPKPPAGKPLTRVEPPATGDQLTNEEATVSPAQVPTKMQTQMMDEQLTAPTRISQNLEKQAAEHAPPPLSFGIAGADGLGGGSANVSVFDGHAQPVVEAAPSNPVVISSGVAAGMLIRKTLPVYPPIAREARVSGTVELYVTISKIGTVKDVQVVNGPTMLRQAAADAVRTWRYKPYVINNEPTEVQTTVKVLFTLGG